MNPSLLAVFHQWALLESEKCKHISEKIFAVALPPIPHATDCEHWFIDVEVMDATVLSYASLETWWLLMAAIMTHASHKFINFVITRHPTDGYCCDVYCGDRRVATCRKCNFLPRIILLGYVGALKIEEAIA